MATVLSGARATRIETSVATARRRAWTSGEYEPLKWKKPAIVAIQIVADLFDRRESDATIDRVFAVIALSPQHTFLVLTKEIERMRDYMRSRSECDDAGNAAEDIRVQISAWLGTPSWRNRYPRISKGVPLGKFCARLLWPLPNLWLGVSVEDQRQANERIPVLLDTPAAMRWIGAEPLLGPVDLTGVDTMHFCGAENLHALEGITRDFMGETMGSVPRIDWIVVGGESGPDARPMHPDWVRGLRNQCKAAAVPFFFKEWGEWAAKNWKNDGATHAIRIDGRVHKFNHRPDSAERSPVATEGWHGIVRVGKRAAGRMLDGRTHDELPRVRA